MEGAVRRVSPWAAGILLVAVLLAGQAAADRVVPSASGAATGGAIGRSGFAYLTGIRTFAAYVLWARLDPVNDAYYNSATLGQKKFLIPSIRIITILDPQFEQPYYVGPFILYDAGLKKGALDLAAEGVANNPASGLLHASYSQLLLTEGRLAEAHVQARLASAGRWYSATDEYNSLAPLEVVFDKTGDTAGQAFVRAERKRLTPIVRPGGDGSTAQ